MRHQTKAHARFLRKQSRWSRRAYALVIWMRQLEGKEWDKGIQGMTLGDVPISSRLIRLRGWWSAVCKTLIGRWLT